MGLRVWSGGEIFSKNINKKSWAHKAPPPIITKVKLSLSDAPDGVPADLELVEDDSAVLVHLRVQNALRFKSSILG